MNTRANIALLPWWKRLLYGIFGKPFADPPLQLPQRSSYSHEQALRDMLHKGISIGVKQSSIVYTCFCERHNIRLHEAMPGVFVCLLCQTGPIPLQQSTDPLQPAHPQLLAYLEKKDQEKKRNPGTSTKEFRAVHLQRVRQG
jgi:hypothetical protein